LPNRRGGKGFSHSAGKRDWDNRKDVSTEKKGWSRVQKLRKEGPLKEEGTSTQKEGWALMGGRAKKIKTSRSHCRNTEHSGEKTDQTEEPKSWFKRVWGGGGKAQNGQEHVRSTLNARVFVGKGQRAPRVTKKTKGKTRDECTSGVHREEQGVPKEEATKAAPQARGEPRAYHGLEKGGGKRWVGQIG